MKPITRIGTALCLLLAASCSDHSDTISNGSDAISDTPNTISEVRESIRDFRYCEITPIFFGPEGLSSDTWNTSDLNDCPAADWVPNNFF